MTSEDPAGAVSGIESLATRQVTSGAAGSMVWRIWGEGRPLLLLHGGSGSWTHWIRNILPLAAHFRVLVPDLPGFGDSPSAGDTADTLADIVAAGLDAIVPPPAELDIAGFSFGGIIGGLVAARLGPRVRVLVLLGAGGLAVPPVSRRLLLRAAPDMAPEQTTRAHRQNLAILMIADPRKIDDLAVFTQMENARRARFKTGDLPASDVLWKALPAIQARVAGIWGSRDAFSGSRVEEYRRALATAQPDLDFRVIEGAGHWTPYEAADQVNAALLEILGGRSRA